MVGLNSAEGSFRINTAERTIHVLRDGYDPLGVGTAELFEACEGIEAQSLYPTLAEDLANSEIVDISEAPDGTRLRYIVAGAAAAGRQSVPWERSVTISHDVPSRVVGRSLAIMKSVDGAPQVVSLTTWQIDEWQQHAGRWIPHRMIETVDLGDRKSTTTYLRESIRADATAASELESLLDHVYREGWEVVDERIGLRFQVGSRRFTLGGCAYDAAEPFVAHPRGDLEDVVRRSTLAVDR